MGSWNIERSRAQHERSEFSCGKAPLDTLLHNLVSQYEKRRLGRTFVATEPGQSRVAGSYHAVGLGGALQVRLSPEEAATTAEVIPIGAAAGTRYPEGGMKGVYI